jgi:rubrerythrin
MEYTIKEIIDIAVGMEDAGMEFYKTVAEKFDDQHIKDIFIYLANQEIEHKKTFQELSSKSGETSGKYNEEYYLYMKAIGGDRIYADEYEDLDAVMSSIHTPVDAINKGFQDEKEAILFYNEIKRYFEGDRETIAILDGIIEEERKHAVRLWDLKESLQNK